MLQQYRVPKQLAERVMSAVTGKRLLLLLAVIMLAGCHSVPKVGPSLPNGDWKTDQLFFQKTYLNHADLKHWRYSAKVGVSTPEAKEYANMIWAFAPEKNNTVRLYGPLGIGAIKIEFDDQQVTLSDRKGVLHQGYSAERLLERIVGWTIPVDALRYWMFSLPMPNRQYEYQLNESDQLSSLRQFGWEIDYSNYRDYNSGYAPFARKIIAKKQVTDEQTVIVTLVTRAWQF